MATQSTPPATYPRQRRRGVIGPLVLIFLGCVFLLQNAGYLPSNFWMSLWRLWPVILVLAGLELLLASRVPWLLLAALSAAVLAIGAVAINSRVVIGPPAERVTRSSSIDLGEATQASVGVRFDAGELNIGSIEQPALARLATITFSGAADQAPQPTYVPTGDGGRLDINNESASTHVLSPLSGSDPGAPRLDIDLNPSVPITSLSIKSGASSAKLDLSGLKLTDVDASVGAASAWIRVPQSGTSTLRISGGASDITIEVPPGVAARMRFRGGLTSITVDASRFPTTGDHQYQSPDFGSNPNSADITIEAGVTRIQVN